MPHAVVIGKHGRGGQSARQRAWKENLRPFKSGPAVIGAALSEVDFFPAAQADVGDVEGRRAPGRSSCRHGLRKPSAKISSASPSPDERIVGGDRIVARGVREVVTVHVDAQNLAAQAVEVLRAVGCCAAVAGRDVEIAVGSEAEPARPCVAGGRCGMERTGAALAASATLAFGAAWYRRISVTPLVLVRLT